VDLEATHGNGGRAHERMRLGRFVLSSSIKNGVSNQFAWRLQRYLVDAAVRWSGYFGGNCLHYGLHHRSNDLTRPRKSNSP
jgi:hypothetical protein